ncbi:ROK family transcriptional regulator [Afifella sp. JA880]|uniref:ROK family transcriptional regulator n=1 Tax=Afifella sp. JA880 TaxID=2975280 RepID=UPI0021BAEE4A|nr:ROK family transcriptional regulator [Afifella sp. JA880]MCT8267760.1 ROK family transcriptional regulator [Afifella sp. JA880]
MRGGDTTGLRAYNERLIIHALLRAGALSKAEIARETGLSGQAASVIVNRLLAEGLLIKRDKVRGQVGQPSTPIAPNPKGAFSLGVKIGRRSVEAILVNLVGEVIASAQESYDAPLPEETVRLAIAQASDLLASLDAASRKRVVGLGIAMPSELESWAPELDLAPGTLDAWRDIDVAAALQEATGLPASLHNDATAACAAEVILGDAVTRRSALYLYLGTFIGGGIVIDGKLYRGEQFNAGAIGSMPTAHQSATGAPQQLIHTASIIQLQQAFIEEGIDAGEALLRGDDVPGAARIFDVWALQAAEEMARAVISAMSVIDFETIVVDGLLPPAWRTRITGHLAEAVQDFNRLGLSRAEIVSGSVGPVARVLGAAMLPLQARFSPNTDLLVRQTITRQSDAEAPPSFANEPQTG